MSRQEDAGNLAVRSSLFLSDLPTLHSTLKRPFDAKILCAASDATVPSKFRCVSTCANDSTKGCTPNEDGKRRRSWDWDSKAKSIGSTQTADVERHSFQVNATSSGVPEKHNSARLWAGPTLMDIESALATLRPATSPLASPKSSTVSRLVQASVSECLNEGTSWQQAPNNPLDSALQESEGEDIAQFVSRKTKETNDPAGAANLEKKSFLTTKLQKRTVPEARYTVKIRSEADNVEDGYRWRKYGQKFIKSSAHPRSYYRCTDARCQVKKQVERSSTEPGVLEVSYEGIHLHHKPYAVTSFFRPQLREKWETTVFTEDEQQQSSSRLTAAPSSSSNKPELHRTWEKSADRNSQLEYFNLPEAAANHSPRRPAPWLMDSNSISSTTYSIFPSRPNRGLLQDLLPPSFVNRAAENL